MIKEYLMLTDNNEEQIAIGKKYGCSLFDSWFRLFNDSRGMDYCRWLGDSWSSILCNLQKSL